MSKSEINSTSKSYTVCPTIHLTNRQKCSKLHWTPDTLDSPNRRIYSSFFEMDSFQGIWKNMVHEIENFADEPKQCYVIDNLPGAILKKKSISGSEWLQGRGRTPKNKPGWNRTQWNFTQVVLYTMELYAGGIILGGMLRRWNRIRWNHTGGIRDSYFLCPNIH